jgi:hypothetical protein
MGLAVSPLPRLLHRRITGSGNVRQPTERRRRRGENPPMTTVRKIAAALTICIGCALFLIALRLDFPFADGDGGFASPGMILAVIFGGAPILTGVLAYRLNSRGSATAARDDDSRG